MTDTILIHCDAVLDTFRQWQAEQEPLDAQLSESLSALAAYQSHLDDWQQQLARERDELRASREQWECERSVAETSDAAALSDVAAQLRAARDESASLAATLDSRDEELRLVREQLERDRSAADFNQARLAELTEELTAARGDIATLTENLLSSTEELRTERQKIEQNESSADHQQEQLAEVSAELNAARDKVSSFSAMLLSRTEELRALDVSRAEACVELDLARVRERELVAALEELRRTRELEQAQWADESRHLREMVERRLEAVGPEYSNERNGNSVSDGQPEIKPAQPTEQNPVFASVKAQFGKLRQQKAMDRPASKKGR